ncbi:hypothetical protein VTN49DRAFT_1510 [Thermomyces lanuginosus]|uniref:uncharacterized protein n=1 Tax=Thermomyces lanuginosus TaxID=5541 RepID=UPI00374350E0
MSAPEGRSWFPTTRLSPASAWNHPDREPADAEQGFNGNELQRTHSLSLRLRQAGGVNSLDNFARSWQRAAAFPELISRRSSFGYDGYDDVDVGADRQPLLQARRSSDTNVLSDNNHSSSSSNVGDALRRESSRDASNNGDQNVLGTSYGTIASRVSEISRQNIRRYSSEQRRRASGTDDDNEDETRDALLIKQVRNQDGTTENVVVGRSTVPQTVFNSVNVLIGVGLLSLPLGLRYSGWLVGLLFLIYSAVSTAYTAKVLAKCLDVDRNLVTYADLAYISFGHRARVVISVLFCLELLGACVALVVLFADSLDALIPGFLSVTQWKVICGLILTPLTFVPLRLLSVTSVLGILSCTAIVMFVIVDGLIKPDAPGSLREPSGTSILPSNWATVPLSFGLIMSPWGGHGVFPNIYRDMRHPEKYGQSLWWTYIVTFSLDFTMAVVGWLMFGDNVRDEVTSNIFLSNDYPEAISIAMITLIAVIPITKVPLSSRPLVATAEVLFGLDGRNSNKDGSSGKTWTKVARQLTRVLVVATIVFISIIFPEFDRIMALMGSALCFTICIILPIAFYLKIFGREIPLGERVLDWVLLILSSIMAIVGTVWAFLPTESLVKVSINT